ncbi:MAG: tricarballylate utilization 4Fe-4S protein TcuB, partial [Pararhizobium sp.]
LAKVRADSYAAYAWPAALQPLFRRNGLAIALIAAVSVAAFILGFVAWHDPAGLVGPAPSFYALMPHNAMAILFGLAALYAIVALTAGYRAFWADIGGRKIERLGRRPVLQAVHDAATLRYLDGGGEGCFNADDQPTDRRRLFHHLTFYGFLLCFAATCAGTLYHYVLGWPAPYAWYQLPKLLGIPGGLALVVGTAGLMQAKRVRDPALLDESRRGMDVAFILMLFLTGLSGLILMLVRGTPLLGVTLAVHLGLVLSLFLTLPYGKFVHGLYRFGALAVHALERRRQASITGS